MNKILKQFSLGSLIIGLSMLFLYLLLISGVTGEVKVSGFYPIISLLFTAIGWWGLANYKKIR